MIVSYVGVCREQMLKTLEHKEIHSCIVGSHIISPSRFIKMEWKEYI